LKRGGGPTEAPGQLLFRKKRGKKERRPSVIFEGTAPSENEKKKKTKCVFCYKNLHFLRGERDKQGGGEDPLFQLVRRKVRHPGEKETHSP